MRAHFISYFVVYTIVTRLIEDFDPEHGIYWRVDPGDLSTKVRSLLQVQSRYLYEQLQKKLPKAVMTQVTNSFSYGLNPRKIGKVDEFDGVGLMHAILSLYPERHGQSTDGQTDTVGISSAA